MTFTSIALGLACLTLGLTLGVMLGLAFARRQLHEYESRCLKAVDESRTDPLTGLSNRKAFDETAAIQAAVARRYGGPLSLLLLDIDRFKAINDAQGHAAGDLALQKLARVIRETSREADFVARLGGDEFAVLLPQTDAAGAAVLARRIRDRLGKTPEICGSQESNVDLKFSGGIASLIANESAVALLDRADRAMYHAKESGRDRVHGHDGTNPVACQPEGAAEELIRDGLGLGS